MPATIVQDWVSADSAATTPASITVNLGVAATAGNLLLVAVNADNTVTTPAGYSLIVSSVHNAGCYLYGKVAAGGETGVTVGPSASASIAVAIAEIGGLSGATVALRTDVSTSNGTSSSVSTLSTGTTGTTAQADEYAVAVWGYSATQGQIAGGGGGQWSGQTNSFLEKLDVGTVKVAGTNVGLCVAVKDLSATGTVESTATELAAGSTYPSESWVATFKVAAGATSVPYTPARVAQSRDYGEAWWTQRDRRSADLVASPANDLASPLLLATRYDISRRVSWPQQRTYFDPGLLTPVATIPTPQRTIQTRDYGEAQWLQRTARDPQLLASALLENELLGGAETGKRTLVPATHAPRWWMPQQPDREGSSPGLLDSALFESPFLGDPDPRHATVFTDRRLVPQQRPYISDPSFYPTVAPTDPLTVAFGSGGSYWLRYNAAALFVDRREVPQQRAYESDPNLLLSALLENELLGGATEVVRRHYQPLLTARTSPAQPRTFGPPTSGDVLADSPRRYLTPITHADRREVPQQPLRLTLSFDAGPDVPPLTLAWGVCGDLWHRYNPRRPARSWWPTWQIFAPTGEVVCEVVRPFSGLTGRPGTGSTGRPDTGLTARPHCD